MDAQSPYVEELNSLRERLKTAQNALVENDEQKRLIAAIKNQRIAELAAQVSQLQAACVSAAQAADLACRRLILYQPVIDAARAAVDGGPLSKLFEAVRILNDSKPS